MGEMRFHHWRGFGGFDGFGGCLAGVWGFGFRVSGVHESVDSDAKRKVWIEP